MYDDGSMRGYKVMRKVGDFARSLADDEAGFPLEQGLRVRMPGMGIYLGTTKSFVLDYYSGLSDDPEVLVTFSCSPKDVTGGSPDEREGEFTVRTAVIEQWQHLE